MKLKRIFAAGAAIISVFAIQLLLACGGGQKAETTENINAFLPEDIRGTDLERSTDVRLYEGQTLYEYIDGGAELYHEYGFVRVATATYKDLLHEITMDIYEFDTPENAYGLYTRIRPAEPEISKLGVEGFKGEGTLDFVKGKYLARMTAFDMSPETTDLESKIAVVLDSIIPGTTSRPEQFSLFPKANMIPYTEMYYAEAYFGHSFLNQVYTQNYALGADTVTLFFCDDPGGEKYLKWSGLVENDEEQSAAIRDMPFDEGSGLIIPDNYFGDLVAGLKGGKLVGMVNYKAAHQKFLSDWLTSLR
jgi:hypothetical protein